ncbi:hypothetical protein FH972_023001 [Carpinus fangiana]|uniref:EthD domain-containing protein n=1 Tax=Carpinus fangiana TaxID=176857 RepID=A0A5N6KTX2_9ROSI|nr:hypothetical protein FH972_023001 [Carpinus fangiana]
MASPEAVGYSLIALIRRKPGVKPQEFQDHFEVNEIPVLRKLAGDTFPLAHQRIYLKRSEEGDNPADVLVGGQEDFPFDAVVLMEFEDKAHADRFFNLAHAEDHIRSFEVHPLMPDRSKSRGVVVSKKYITTPTSAL